MHLDSVKDAFFSHFPPKLPYKRGDFRVAVIFNAVFWPLSPYLLQNKKIQFGASQQRISKKNKKWTEKALLTIRPHSYFSSCKNESTGKCFLSRTQGKKYCNLLPQFYESCFSQGSDPFFLMAGPNVIQSEEHIFKMCRQIKQVTDR